MVAQGSSPCKVDSVIEAARELGEFVKQAATAGSTFDELERGVVQRVLEIGRLSIGIFLGLQGDGDVGETFTLPEGKELRRLPKTHGRELLSVFGEFTLERAVYGSREGQKIELIPLDSRLGLPEGKLSYLLEDWNGLLATEQPFGQVAKTLEQILGLRQHVDTLEQMTRRMAAAVEGFRDERPTPPADEEGSILVRSGDGKGVPIRRPSNEPKIEQHRSKSGPKLDRKRMAIVGVVYSVDPYLRTPEEVAESLFRDPQDKDPERPKRPRPQHKRAWASLTRVDADGEERLGLYETFAWLSGEVQRRVTDQTVVVNLMDGQESLWETLEVCSEEEDRDRQIDILDLLHVTPRLWKAVALFHPVASIEAEKLLRRWTLRILSGQVEGVIRSIRQMGYRNKLSAAKREAIAKICNYFGKNKQRMGYDEYLSKGYPIASGAVEGACRHLVKDRMERTGMSWTIDGAQAMLDLRSVAISHTWAEFIADRTKRETARLYPHRQALKQLKWSFAL